MTYGERLNFARKRSGMTQTELGKRCGLSKQAISNYEQDVVGNIPLNKVRQIAEVLDCNPAFICYFLRLLACFKERKKPWYCCVSSVPKVSQFGAREET